MFDVGFRPRNRTPERWKEGVRVLVAELYNQEAVARRHPRFFHVYGEAYREAHLRPREVLTTSP